MDNRTVLNKIESVMIDGSDRKRRPFGINFQYNIANAIAYFYDRSHITGYKDIQHLEPVLLEQLNDSKIVSWPTPVKYEIENDRNVVMIKIATWNHSLALAEYNCDFIVRVTYLYKMFVKNEFHIRIV